jgi:hypothetical protein
MDDLIDGLLIPAAFFGDDLVYVHQGRTGDRYRCAGENCSVPVIWKESYDREDGVLVRAHFSHISGGAGSCVESARHKIAKLTVVKQINRWLDGSGPVPVLSGKCKACGMVNVHQLWWLSPSETARNEYRLPSGRVADVWAGFAVEVHETHEVDADKAHDLSTDNIQWIEIEA